jgi:hypothetical protein
MNGRPESLQVLRFMSNPVAILLCHSVACTDFATIFWIQVGRLRMVLCMFEFGFIPTSKLSSPVKRNNERRFNMCALLARCGLAAHPSVLVTGMLFAAQPRLHF